MQLIKKKLSFLFSFIVKTGLYNRTTSCRERKGDFFLSVVTAGTDEERIPYFLTRLYSSVRDSGNVCQVNCLIVYDFVVTGSY